MFRHSTRGSLRLYKLSALAIKRDGGSDVFSATMQSEY